VDIIKLVRVDPFIFCVVDFKATVGGDADIGQIDAIEDFWTLYLQLRLDGTQVSADDGGGRIF
jgi:hypothetical protein